MEGLILVTLIGLLFIHQCFEMIRESSGQLRTRVAEVGRKCSLGLHGWDNCVCRRCRTRRDRHHWVEWACQSQKSCFQKRACEHCGHAEWRSVAHHWDSSWRAGRCRGLCRGLCRYRDLFHLKLHVRIPPLTMALSSPFSVRTHVCNNKCAPSLDHCLCCFLPKRLLTTACTVDSTHPVAIGSPLR